MTGAVCDNYLKQIFDAMIKKKTQDIISMQIIEELLVQMRINRGMA